MSPVNLVAQMFRNSSKVAGYSLAPKYSSISGDKFFFEDELQQLRDEKERVNEANIVSGGPP